MKLDSKKKKALCEAPFCENRDRQTGQARIFKECHLCQANYDMLVRGMEQEKVILQEATSRDEESFWVDAALQNIREIHEKEPELVYKFYRALIFLCYQNHKQSIAHALDCLYHTCPIEAADCLDYSTKERFGGGLYPTLSWRITNYMQSLPEDVQKLYNFTSESDDEVPF